ncbi:hypothetical protein GOBAR_AA38754 [Gossypium barbadense]|uniref:Uncharacterized protein n=1 Tax=Gossypium barbadense TaxID=3634 RepID=A0A2P5VSZ6_GOSBA|nr:hypothetical protein GOBAR_AA38754 [Gossypium barbadense]
MCLKQRHFMVPALLHQRGPKISFGARPSRTSDASRCRYCPMLRHIEGAGGALIAPHHGMAHAADGVRGYRTTGGQRDRFQMSETGTLFSAQRSRTSEAQSKATLPLTIPRRVFKSSAKDSTRRSVGITLQGGIRDLSAAVAPPTTLALRGQRPLLRVGNRATGACVASSPDSDLEAFSHNPAHGSFAPLAFQPSAMTNCANQRFLSY